MSFKSNYAFLHLKGLRKSEEENLLAENDRMLDNLAGKVSRLKAVRIKKMLIYVYLKLNVCRNEMLIYIVYIFLFYDIHLYILFS